MKAGVMAEPALVGRSRELEELMGSLDSAFEGKGATVFVSGEAGSGKTKLVNEFLNSAKQKKKVTTLTGLCLSNAAVPYLPFIEAFNAYFVEKEGEHFEKDELEVNDWLTGAKQAEKGEKTGKYSNLSPQAWRDLTFAAISKALFTMSARKPVVLFIEDLHWADTASLSLLHFIARTSRSQRVLLLATFRSEELTTDAEGYTHPLAEELRFMKRENLLKEITLSSLSQEYVAEIAKNMLGGAVGSELAAKLAEESRGNALFLIESLRMLSEGGCLYQENDMWNVSLDTLGIPSKFKDIVLRRLSLLKFNQRRVLDAASVIGERFDVDLLSAVLGQDSLEVLEALNSIARSTSLLRVEEGFFMFDHAKSRLAIYEEIASPLKKGYHRRVAEKIASSSKDNKLPFSEVAYHYAQAGDEEKAVKFALDAGQDALERFSNAEAIKHFTYVMEKAHGTTENAEMRRVALEGLGDAFFANCMYNKALEVFERLTVSETGEARLRAYRKAMDSALWLGKRSRLVELASKAEPYAASNRLENARIRFISAPVRNRAYAYSDTAKRFADFESTLRIFEEEYSLPDVARALIPLSLGLSTYYTRTQKFGKGVNAFLRSIAMHEELGDLRGLLEALLYAGESFWWYGVLIHEMRDILVRAVQIGERIGHYDRTAQALGYLALSSEYLGHFEEAISQTLKAIEYNSLTERETGTGKYKVYEAALARMYAKSGDMKRAEEHSGLIAIAPLKLQEVIAAGYASDGGPTSRTQTVVIIRTQGILLAIKNIWNEASEWFEKGIEFAKTAPVGAELVVRKDYVWALERQGRTEEAKIQLEKIAEITMEAEEAFAHVSVEASLIAPRLVTVGEEFEIRLDLVNVSKKRGTLVKVEGVVPSEFTISTPPTAGNMRNGSVEFAEERINAFQVVTIKPVLKALKVGTFNLNPRLTYIDESSEIRTSKSTPVTITVQPAKHAFEVLPNRVATGYVELDALLFGGIPEKCAVALVMPSSDERELLITRFLSTGAEAGEITFNLTAELANAKTLAEKYSTVFYLVLCSPQADSIVQSLPNVFKLKGVENLTEIDIALTKAFRTLNPSVTVSRRFCIGIVSDVLLQHHAVATRRWLSALLPTLKSKGFTVLAVVNPQMHPSEEVQAILSSFEGEIRNKEKETPQGVKQALRVRRLCNQKFRDEELVIDRDRLEQ